MLQQPVRLYAAFVGGFLLLHGTSTLAFRLFPALDQAFPPLLAVTRMIPPHSLLHILTGTLALVALWRGGPRGALWYAAGFGLFYIGLGLVGMLIGHPTMLGLQAFDHSFHYLVGGLGLLAAGLEAYGARQRKPASP